MRKIRDNHMNFVKSPNIVCKRTSTHEHYKAILGLQTNKRGCLSETRHLLNHNDVGSQHLKTSGEVHNIGPAKNQSPSHRHDLFCHSSGPQHTQDHNQNRVANSATEMQGNEACMNAYIYIYIYIYIKNLQSDMEGSSKGRLAKIAFSSHSQNTGNLKTIHYKECFGIIPIIFY